MTISHESCAHRPPRRPGRLDGSRLSRLLHLALAESGAERAYVAIRDAEAAPIDILASASSDGADERPFSRTVVRQALSAGGPLVCLDPGSDARFSVGASVRRLALRCVVCAAFPPGPGPDGALVLDSRLAPSAPVAFLQRLAETLAPVAALFSQPGPPGGGTLPERPRPVPDAGHGEWIRRIAPTDLPVLIQGETGSGKERVAEELHRLSRRAGAAPVSVNCAAFTESLLDSELFGAVRGAYTGADRDRPGLFERAAGGTLFLDEVGDMPPSMQARLLRVLETRRVLPVGAQRERSVDVRIVTATHRDLRAQVRSESFRADLYHRLAVLQVHVLPLRERLKELPELVSALSPRLERETGLTAPRLDSSGWEALANHPWPGNVRELHAVLARAWLRAEGSVVSARELGLGAPRDGRTGVLREDAMIVRALEASPESLAAAARSIGWTRQKLYRRMRALGIERAAAIGDSEAADPQ